MQQRSIAGVSVGAIGLGAMPMSVAPYPERSRSLATIAAALDAGVRLIDTADAYCAGSEDFGHNELLVAEALRAWGGDPDEVLVATKGGHIRTRSGAWDVDGGPAYLRRACEASLRRLGVEAIGLYQHHRPDPRVPYAETIGALKELKDQGLVRHVGISNANPDQIREAIGIVEIASVQNQLSPRFRSSEPELDLCGELGIAFLPWSPLGGMSRAASLGSSHAAFAAVAAERGVSPQRVALAWELAKGPHVIPIPGASRVESILDSVAAADLQLTDEELARLDSSDG